MATTSSAGAGGGNPSSTPILPTTLSPAILTHLKHVYADLPHHSIPDDSQTTTDLPEDDNNHKPPSFDAFLAYMTSSLSDAQGPPPWKSGRQLGREGEDEEEGRDRLAWPLSSYFVSSSHNTYLTGNQLYSQASGDAYRNVRVSSLCLVRAKKG